MYNHDGTSSFLKIAAVLVFIAVGVWWVESRFSATAVLIVLGALVGVIAFVGGALLTHQTQRHTLDAMTKFNANDAQIDRYRQQSFKAMAQGEAAMRRAEAQMTVLNAKRVDRLATQKANLLTDAEKAKWEAQQSQSTYELWDIDSNDDGDFQEWG